MRKKFTAREFIHRLTALGERQFDNERKAAELIQKVLIFHQVEYIQERFTLDVPFFKRAVLRADGKIVPCRGCGFKSGVINGRQKPFDSFKSGEKDLIMPNINYNPRCQAISRPVFFSAPAVAVCRAQAALVKRAAEIQGELTVTKKKHHAVNIAVGNRKAPEFVCFAHYDSIGPGAIDNAAGVSVMLEAIINGAADLARGLYVFAAAEELSFDWPVYWGFGYRAWEKSHEALLSRVKKIIVLDGPGNGPTRVLKGASIIYDAFPIKNFKCYKRKINLLTGDYERLMSVYHSELDDGRTVRSKYLNDAGKTLHGLTKI